MGELYIGVAGWAYKDWEGIVYPKGLKKTQHPVEFLARYFDLIEINTSFYGHIKPDVGREWCRKAGAVNPKFQFTAKLNKIFTHSPIAVVESTSAKTIRFAPEDEKPGERRIRRDRIGRATGCSADAVSHLVSRTLTRTASISTN